MSQRSVDFRKSWIALPSHILQERSGHSPQSANFLRVSLSSELPYPYVLDTTQPARPESTGFRAAVNPFPAKRHRKRDSRFPVVMSIAVLRLESC